MDRLRAEEKWQSRARLTETSFDFLEAEKNEASSHLPFDPELQRKAADEVEDWHFERPQVCFIFNLQFIVGTFASVLVNMEVMPAY